jgi:hypothetical protein
VIDIFFFAQTHMNTNSKNTLPVSREDFEALQHLLRQNAFAWANIGQFYGKAVLTAQMTVDFHQELRLESNRLYDALEVVRKQFNNEVN